MFAPPEYESGSCPLNSLESIAARFVAIGNNARPDMYISAPGSCP